MMQSSGKWHGFCNFRQIRTNRTTKICSGRSILMMRGDSWLMQTSKLRPNPVSRFTILRGRFVEPQSSRSSDLQAIIFSCPIGGRTTN
jgi:hypothetical protein